MAFIGLSKPMAAIHSSTPGLYTKRFTIGEYIGLTITPNEPSDGALRGDNKDWDTDDSFNGGTAECETTRLSPSSMVDALGIKEQAISSAEGAPKHYVFDRTQKAPHIALSGIAMVRDDADPQTYYQAYILEDIKFRNPTFAITTKGKNIEWATPKLTATIFESEREDTNVDHPWLFVSELFDSEDDAEDYIETMLALVTTGGGT